MSKTIHHQQKHGHITCQTLSNIVVACVLNGKVHHNDHDARGTPRRLTNNKLHIKYLAPETQSGSNNSCNNFPHWVLLLTEINWKSGMDKYSQSSFFLHDEITRQWDNCEITWKLGCVLYCMLHYGITVMGRLSNKSWKYWVILSRVTDIQIMQMVGCLAGWLDGWMGGWVSKWIGGMMSGGWKGEWVGGRTGGKVERQRDRQKFIFQCPSPKLMSEMVYAWKKWLWYKNNKISNE